MAVPRGLHTALVALEVAYSVWLPAEVFGLLPRAHHHLRGRRGLDKRVVCGRAQFKVALVSHLVIGDDQSLDRLV